MVHPRPSVLVASLARLVADASSLDVMLSRVAVLLREAIPFERLHVLRLDHAESVTLYAVRASGEVEVTGHLIGDGGAAAAGPQDIHERSKIIATVRQRSHVQGAVWLTSSEPDAFTD
jgi:hypothetical protein